MNALDYLLKANLYGLLFVGCYWLFLRRHTFFSLNRVYLLLSTVLSLLLPFAGLPAKTVETLPQLTLPSALAALPQTMIEAPAMDSLPTSSGTDWAQIGLILYGLIVLLLLVRLGVRIGRLLWLIRRSPRQLEGDFWLVQPHDPAIATFSFFRFLVLNPVDANNNLILRHELVHIRQWHSADVVGIATLRSIFWAFPTLWLADRLLRQVHEFLADKQPHQPTDYARFLVNYTFGLQTDSLTNGFFIPSLLKLRIQMLHQRATARWALGKYVLVLPLVFGLLAMTTARENIKEIISQATQPGIVISGLVTGPNGKPLAGATVVVKNARKGASANSEGVYTLSGLGPKPVLVASHIGFATKEIQTQGQTVVNITLEQTKNQLSPLLVVGYEGPPESTGSTTQQSSLTSSTGEVFTIVEQQPEFPGGKPALGQYLRSTIRYPADAHRYSIQGNVLVEFTITADGTIDNAFIQTGIGGGCNEEALRVVRQMPKWNPGKQNGNPVATQFVLPIKFELEKFEDKRTGQVIPTTQPDSARKFGVIIDKSKNAPFALYNDVDNGGNKERYTMPLPDSLQNPRSSASIRIRGNVLTDGEPLYIIDGVEAPTGGIRKITPDRIENITVLKGSAAATYGPKAQYGVILITTKKK
ncbi:TonB family protein [Spirosoma luteum]|uniref:TonB family protein n=1 Tax=Spirosoma luteum TaxID=431553 RepID=UPI0003643218|nr:TonB family protein [Spirosoma luteum]